MTSDENERVAFEATVLSESGDSMFAPDAFLDADTLESFKPRAGRGSRGIRRCYDMAQLCQAMSGAGPMIAQRLIGDEDHEYTVGVLGTENGDILGSITLRRYLKDGITSAAEVVDDTEIRRYAEQIVSVLRPRGYCNVQLRLDDRRPCAFEVNGRISSSTAFRALAGFNEPEILIRHYLLGESPEPYSPRIIRMVRALEERIVDDDRWRRFHTE